MGESVGSCEAVSDCVGDAHWLRDCVTLRVSVCDGLDACEKEVDGVRDGDVVAAREVVCVDVHDPAWLPETVGEAVAYMLGVTLGDSLAVGDSVNTVVND